MNIFYTNSDPKLCALDHCDIHVRKMIVEYCQLLSTAHRLIDGHESLGLSKSGRKQKQWILPDHREQILYKATHVNHPSAKWVRANLKHYLWLVEVVGELLDIYEAQSLKVHKVKDSGLYDILKSPPNLIEDNSWEDPYLAINKDLYGDLVSDFMSGYLSTVDCYRKYLSLKFMEWRTRQTQRRITPSWPIQTPSWI